MTDRERLLQGLRLCADGRPCYKDKFRECPYTPIGQMPDYNCAAAMARDALGVLEGQETATPKRVSSHGGQTWWYVCGGCGWGIDPKDKKCGHCGRRLAWNAAD